MCKDLHNEGDTLILTLQMGRPKPRDDLPKEVEMGLNHRPLDSESNVLPAIPL